MIIFIFQLSLMKQPSIVLFSLLAICCASHHNITSQQAASISKPLITGADQTEKYIPLLKGKRIAVLANPSTIIGEKHLVDSLLSAGINIVKVFGPEHGFRGNASNGVKVEDEKDSATGIPIISLYGNKRKPSAEDMKDVDLMIFDIQDVGCRFYTHINVLADVMEACAENNKEVLILDRPNPNGYFVDGPVLDMKFLLTDRSRPVLKRVVNNETGTCRTIKCQQTAWCVLRHHSFHVSLRRVSFGRLCVDLINSGYGFRYYPAK